MSLIEYNKVEILRKELVVLKDVTFNVEAGQMIYLTGKVGSGKSSLLKTLYAEVPVSRGEAHIFDYDLCQLRRRDIPYLRRRIGIVFQDFRLLTDRNVYANLEFVLAATGWSDRAEREQRIDEVLRAVDMANKSYKMPHELSGGEQQRVVIARALLNRPELILADEPTGNLDPDTGLRIAERLHRLTEETGAAVIMATHNHSLIQAYPGRTMRIDNKQLITE